MAAPFSRVRRDEIAEDLKNAAIKKLAEIEMKKISVDSLVDIQEFQKGHFINFSNQKTIVFGNIRGLAYTNIRRCT